MRFAVNDKMAGLVRMLTVALSIFILLTVNYSWSVVAYEELEYDANGNLVQDGSFYYEYDGWQRLRRVRENASSGRLLAEYWYTPEGIRLKKVIYGADGANETTVYVGDFVRVINSSGTFDTKYVRDDKGTLLAVIDPQNKTFYYHPDHLGSTRLVTDESGEVVEETEYMPFGAVISGGSDRFGYTGHEEDPETNLIYAKARYYNPYLGKFTQPDTIIQNVYNPQNLNRYSYVMNNPLKYIDPSGHRVKVVLEKPLDKTTKYGSGDKNAGETTVEKTQYSVYVDGKLVGYVTSQLELSPESGEGETRTDYLVQLDSGEMTTLSNIIYQNKQDPSRAEVSEAYNLLADAGLSLVGWKSVEGAIKAAKYGPTVYGALRSLDTGKTIANTLTSESVGSGIWEASGYISYWGTVKAGIDAVRLDTGMSPWEPIPGYQGPIDYGAYHDEGR